MESSEATKKLETAEAHKNRGNDFFKSINIKNQILTME